MWWQNGLNGLRGFNTQPPEGGWDFPRQLSGGFSCFNTQPPEGGWVWFVKLADTHL